MHNFIELFSIYDKEIIVNLDQILFYQESMNKIYFNNKNIYIDNESSEKLLSKLGIREPSHGLDYNEE